jgi:hypothetical protein
MPPHAEQAPHYPGTEHEPYIEEANTAEILTEEFQKELADLGFVSILEEAYDRPETADGPVSGKPLSADEQAWMHDFETSWPEVEDDGHDNRQTGSENNNNHTDTIIVLIEDALRRLNQRSQKRYYQAPDSNEKRSSSSKKRAPKRRFTGDYDYYEDLDRYKRDYRPTDTTPAPRPDFGPAPSVGEMQGPQLPRLAYNDRVRPTSVRPTQADFAAAARANEMLQRSLFKKGWQGGEATPEQMKAAHLDMVRTYHPDRPGADAADTEAFKQYVSSDAHSKKVSQAKRAPQPEAAPEPKPEPKPQATSTPEAASSEPTETEPSRPAPSKNESAPAETRASTPEDAKSSANTTATPAIAAAPAPAPAPASEPASSSSPSDE